jgi:sporulation protein YlmC with PRC-barrel domain
MKFRRMIAGIAALGVASAMPVMANCGNCDHDEHKKSDTAKMSSSSKHHKDKDATLSQSGSRALSDGEMVRLSKVTNAKVLSQDGKRLGELEDVVINPQTGKIQFAILGHGGVLGIGEDRIPVPWEQFSFDAEQQQFSLNMDEERLASAPKLDRDYSDLNDSNFANRIEEFYNSSEDVGGSVDLESSSPEAVSGSEDMDTQIEGQSGESSKSDTTEADRSDL